MIIITGLMTIPDENKDQFFAISRRQVDLSRLEEGCVNYWLCEDFFEPGKFFFYEE